MLSLLYSAVLGQFQLEPRNLTVLQGSDAQFNATVMGHWKVMTWTVGKKLVLSIPATGNATSSSEQYSARFCSSGDTSCVELTIHNVNRSGTESWPVICSVLGPYGSKTSQLYVQGRVNNIYQVVVVFKDFGQEEFGTLRDTCCFVAVL